MTDKKDKVKERIFTVFFMLIVTIVFISALTVVYVQTQEIIETNETLMFKRSVLYAAGISIPSDKSKLLNVYDESVKIVDKDKSNTYYQILKNGKIKSYIFLRSGPGLWGTITAVVGLQKDLKTLTGIEFTKQNETPGLGARISEDWFKEQFREKVGPINRLVPEKEPANNGEFCAVTGATISSTAVKMIINDLIEDAPKLVK